MQLKQIGKKSGLTILKGKDKKLWCSGIRNTEKLVIRPGTDEIWGMDHGSDWFGKRSAIPRGNAADYGL